MEIQSTDVPVHPMDTSVTVQAVGDKYLVTSHHRHPDGLHSFSCSALVAKESQDLRACSTSWPRAPGKAPLGCLFHRSRVRLPFSFFLRSRGSI